ncbi:MAG: hypothetical protein ACI9HU_001633, partial [Colwellia sp.]
DKSRLMHYWSIIIKFCAHNVLSIPLTHCIIVVSVCENV